MSFHENALLVSTKFHSVIFKIVKYCTKIVLKLCFAKLLLQIQQISCINAFECLCKEKICIFMFYC